MLKYIPLTLVKSLFDDSSNLLDSGQHEAFVKRVEESASEMVLSQGYSQTDLVAFVKGLWNSSSIVFHDWIAQNEVLSKALLNQKIEADFIDTKGHLEHQFGEEFKRFISPYLSPILIAAAGSKDQAFETKFSFTKLLDEDHRATIEFELFKPLKVKIKALQEIVYDQEEEQELVQLAYPMCSDGIIDAINHMSKASYSLKLEYVDGMLSIIRSDGCTHRLANWILKHMERIELNDEHQYKLKDLRRDLKTGRLKVNNVGKRSVLVSRKAFITATILLLLGGTLLYLLIAQPFNDSEEPKMASGSSFKEFTVEERKHMDSLLREIDRDFRGDENLIDPHNPTFSGGNFTFRHAFANERLEKYYNDLAYDAELKLNYPMRKCESDHNLSGFQRNDGIRDLERRSADHRVVVRNPGDYEIIVIVGSNFSGGEVYSLKLDPGKSNSFEMNQGDIILFVVGNDFQKFVAPQSSPSDEHPSGDFDYHFCSTDDNYAFSFDTPYVLSQPDIGTSKLLLMGSNGSEFRVVDSKNVLEAY